MTPANVLRGPQSDNVARRAFCMLHTLKVKPQRQSLVRWRRRAAAVARTLVIALLCPCALFGQTIEVRGHVRDSASGDAVAGAVVMLLSDRGDTVHRTISGTAGQFRIERPPTAVQVRVLRLGFVPRSMLLPPTAEATTNVVVMLAQATRALPAVSAIVARGCPTPPTGAEAFGLLDQARAGLLATVVARERLPSRMRVVQYQRQISLDGTTIEQQAVRIDSTVQSSTSFSARQSTNDLLDRGFRTGTKGEYTYSAPDADVLLDEQFQRAYCFSLALADSTRPTQHGLRFSPVRQRSGKVDIAGTIWMDTLTRTLSDIEFTYVGVDPLTASLGSGGRLSFHTLPNGLSFVSRWSMRLIGARDPMVNPSSAQNYSIREVGGEVAEAQVGDSASFSARLGTAHITAVTSEGTPVAAARLRFANSDYRAFTNAAGRASIPFVLPGPYQVFVDDVAFEPIGLSILLPNIVEIPRGASSIMRLVVPTAEQFVAPLCAQAATSRGDAWVVARVVDDAGEPRGGASYQVIEVRNGQSIGVAASGTVPPTGIIAVCTLTRDTDIEIAVWKSRSAVTRVRQRLDRKISVMRVSMPLLALKTSARPDSASFVVEGTVRDSVNGAGASNARVTFLGTSLETTADDSGRFIVGGLAAGVHRVEVSTPWLDSIGAVRRTTVTIGDGAPVALFLPSVLDALRSSCGALIRNNGDGAIVGQILTKPGEAHPVALRVVAEWDSIPAAALAPDERQLNPPTVGTSRPRVRSRAMGDVLAGGTFRVCGVPTEQAIVVRLELGDSTIASPRRDEAPPGDRIGGQGVAGSDISTERLGSQDVRIGEARRFARVDFSLWTP